MWRVCCTIMCVVVVCAGVWCVDCVSCRSLTLEIISEIALGLSPTESHVLPEYEPQLHPHPNPLGLPCACFSLL